MSHVLSRITAPALVTAMMSTAAIGAEDMSVDEIKNGFRVNAALAQFHRWYLLYEEPAYGLENQLDILAEDVSVVSGLGEATGHSEYAERVSQLPTSWHNAHDVKSTAVTVNDDGSISLSADITYLNRGMLENDAIRSAEVSYTTTLTPSSTVLPKFSSISIVGSNAGEADTFVSAYGDNRMLSLVHYWLALIEDPARNPDPVQEILADGFSLNFSSGAITDFEGFKAWLAGPGSSVTASTHRIGDFSQELVGDNQYAVSMTFDWNGILPDGTELAARTKHTWSVIDDPTKRFAQIKTVDVEILEPFAPKE